MSCFYVIGPIGRDVEFRAKSQILKSVGASHGCVPFFPLEQHSGFSIMDAQTDFRNAKFVLADLSYERPSCYFELGLAQALGARVVIIAETGTLIHQVGDSMA